MNGDIEYTPQIDQQETQKHFSDKEREEAADTLSRLFLKMFVKSIENTTVREILHKLIDLQDAIEHEKVEIDILSINKEVIDKNIACLKAKLDQEEARHNEDSM